MGSFDERLTVQFRRLGRDSDRIRRELERQAVGRQLYGDDDGNPVLKESYVVFLDSLGTRARVESLDDAKLRKDLELLRYRWLLHDDEREGGHQRFLSFKDNVVVGTPVVIESMGE